jgi:hypothetical protein
MCDKQVAGESSPSDKSYAKAKSVTLVVGAVVSIVALFVSIATVVADYSKNSISMKFSCLTSELDFNSKFIESQTILFDSGMNYIDAILNNLSATEDTAGKSHIFKASAWPLLRDDTNRKSWSDLQRATYTSTGPMKEVLEQTTLEINKFRNLYNRAPLQHNTMQQPLEAKLEGFEGGAAKWTIESSLAYDEMRKIRANILVLSRKIHEIRRIRLSKGRAPLAPMEIDCPRPNFIDTIFGAG